MNHGMSTWDVPETDGGLRGMIRDIHPNRLALVLILLLGLVFDLAQAAEAPWNVQTYNPVPAEGDLILPMPCGGGMAFRRVNVPSGGIFDDHRVTLGSHEENRGYAEYRRISWIAGGFTTGDSTGERHYFIGKYEVTRMQRDALTARCPDPEDPDGELPATEISWSEAMLFAERYSEWLVSRARDTLPVREGAVGFLRLPTETEWEFAARGGTAVSPSVFAAKTFVPEGKSLDSYVIHDGNSYRELNAIGTRDPNPLKIHDILGNAAELVLTPFQLNVVSHLHGQVGGAVRRGGSYRTRPPDIRVSHREEYTPIDQRGVRREKTTGFRVALVAPVLASLKSVKTVRTAWKGLQREPETPGTPDKKAPEESDPVSRARRLAVTTANLQMKRELEELAFTVAKSNQARQEERRRAAREALSSAVFAARWVMNDRKILRRWRPLLDRGTDPVRRQRIKDAYETARRNGAINLTHYIDLLTAMAQDYGQWELDAQRPVVASVYAARGQQIAQGLVRVVAGHVDAVRRRGPDTAREEIVESLERRL